MNLFKQSSKKYHNAWAMYDWANSAYNLVITSTIFPAYYTAITTVKEGGQVVNDTVDFFGWQVKNSALFEYILGFAYLIIALSSPILSAIADYKGTKKPFMTAFVIIGATCCCLLYFFTAENVAWSMVLFAIAALGYTGSIVFYNSYLPEIATYEDRDNLSAKGFAWGYIGSVLLQIICLFFVLNEKYFEDPTFAARISFFLVGLWWLGFAIIPLYQLPNGRPSKTTNKGLIKGAQHELSSVWRQIKNLPVLKNYLTAFFFYSTGVQTVMLAATIFGSKELQLNTDQLIITILLIQIIAIFGAFLMSRLSARMGNIPVLLVTVLLWIVVCILAYNVYTAMQFYMLASIVGLVMGGIQSLSRSTYSKLMPETHDTTSFFSFYDVVEKLAIVLGMFSFGLIDEHFGMRQSIIAVTIYFILGAVFLIITLRKQRQQS